MAACGNQGDWAFLLPEITDIILEKLTDSFSAFVSFISVCQRWRFLALDEDKEKSDNVKKLEILRTCRNQLPLLVAENESFTSVNRWFFTLQSDKNGYQMKKQLNCPGLCSYCGSSFGWLIGLQRRPTHPWRPAPGSIYAVGIEIVLFNPFSCAVKRLPLLLDDTEFHDQFLGDYNKGVISSDPSIEGRYYELLLIHQAYSRLACYRSRTNSWRRMQVNQQQHGRVADAAFYGGKIYAVTFVGNLLQGDFDTGETKVVVNVFHWNRTRSSYVGDSQHSGTLHLVVSNEGHNLLLVKQHTTQHFEVFKLCCCEEEAELWTWVDINNLDDQALFVGCHYQGSSSFSACVSTVEFPHCRPNCIYYTCGARGRGVFNLDLKQHLESACMVSGADVGLLSSQIWMVPNLKGS